MTTPSAEKIRKAIDEHLAARNADDHMILADGFEEAFMGTANHPVDGLVAVYDAAKCIQILIDRDAMEPEDAEDFFFFNTVGTYVGPKTPMFFWPLLRARGDEYKALWVENA